YKIRARKVVFVRERGRCRVLDLAVAHVDDRMGVRTQIGQGEPQNASLLGRGRRRLYREDPCRRRRNGRMIEFDERKRARENHDNRDEDREDYPWRSNFFRFHKRLLFRRGRRGRLQPSPPYSFRWM